MSIGQIYKKSFGVDGRKMKQIFLLTLGLILFLYFIETYLTLKGEDCIEIGWTQRIIMSFFAAYGGLSSFELEKRLKMMTTEEKRQYKTLYRAVWFILFAIIVYAFIFI